MTVETSRLIIRPYEKNDYLVWHEGYQGREPATYKHDAGNDGEYFSERWFHKWVDEFQQEARKDRTYLFGIFRKEDGAHIGEIELVTIMRDGYDWAMMGYAIHNQFHRQGYGKESIEAIYPICFYELNFNRLELQIDVDNEPSRSFAENVGFMYECIREQFFYEEGKWKDQIIYVKNKDRFI